MNERQTSAADPAGAREPWTVDADMPLQSFLEWPGCPPLLRDTLNGVLSWQTRIEIPVRRALTSPRLAPQWVAALLALGATVTTEGDDGPAEIALEAMLRHRDRNVSALHVPPGGPDLRLGEADVARTPADAPIVAVFAAVELADAVVRQARVALSGVWPEPARLAASPTQLEGGPLDDAHIQAVAAALVEEVAPKGDFLGSEEYRRAMAGVLTRRALASCLPGRRGGDE